MIFNFKLKVTETEEWEKLIRFVKEILSDEDLSEELKQVYRDRFKLLFPGVLDR